MLYVLVFSLNESMHHMPEFTELLASMWCWESNLGPLEEQLVLTNTEPSLQSPKKEFNWVLLTAQGFSSLLAAHRQTWCWRTG